MARDMISRAVQDRARVQQIIASLEDLNLAINHAVRDGLRVDLDIDNGLLFVGMETPIPQVKVKVYRQVKWID